MGEVAPRSLAKEARALATPREFAEGLQASSFVDCENTTPR
jgi:hypothetical protein